MFFVIMISKSGDRLSVLDGPPDLTQELGMNLRASFPRRITTDRATEDGLHIFEVKKGSYGGEFTTPVLPTPNSAVSIAISIPIGTACPVALCLFLPLSPPPTRTAVAVDKSLLVAVVLRFFNQAGYRLCASVPMGTRSIFHLSPRKEMWVFRNDALRARAAAQQKEYPMAPAGRRPSSRQSRGDHPPPPDQMPIAMP